MRAALQDLHNIPDLTEKDLQDINDIDAAVAEFEDAITTILQNGKEVYDSPAIEGNTPDAQRQQAALLKEKAEQNSKLMQESQENLGIAIGKAMGRWNGMTNMEMGKSRRFHIISDFLMLFIYIVGMAAILIIGNVVRKKEEKLAMKEEEASYQQSKAESATQKTIDIAYKNLVMDCGNKYALLNYVDEVLSSEQEIFVSKLELGDYDAILSMVGLSEMDNYMSVMSNRIKAAYAECGTLFTLSGRDFVFAFNPTITAQQAMEFTEDMKRIIGNIPSALSVQVGSPILSSMAYTGNFKNKNSDSLLTNLHIACLNSRLSGITVTI